MSSPVISISSNNISVFLFHQAEKDDFDPFADRRRPTIAEKEDEYRQKRRRLVISPERADPFADGLYFFFVKFYQPQKFSLTIKRSC